MRLRGTARHESSATMTDPRRRSRRDALRVAAGLAGAVALSSAPVIAQPGGAQRRSFVLVHGAWHGGWCWRRVADRLEAAGHKVFTPTLTGLGERSHLLTSSLSLDTHILDVANVISWEGLSEVVLVGHSYAGFVVSGVVERLPSAIAAIALVDAYVPSDGQSMYDVATPSSRASLEAAMKSGDPVRAVPTAASFNVNERDRAWVDAKMTLQPVAPQLQKLRVSGALERIRPKAYVRAVGYPNPTFDAVLATVRSRGGWETHEVRSGHDVMVDRPDELVKILVGLL